MAQQNGAHTNAWDILPGKVRGQKTLEEIVPNARVIFLCINSWHLKNAAKTLRPLLNPKTIIVSPSKGIDAKTGKTIDALLADAFGKTQPIALLSGPMLAHELAKGQFGAAVLATASAADFNIMNALFKKSALYLTHATDLRGTALAGVLKNIYALLLGVADGLHLNQNAKGVLAARATEEMQRVIKTLSPKSNAIAITLGPAGLGDLIATGFSAASTNVRMGRALATGTQEERMSEGFMALPPLLKRLGTRAKHFPLLLATNTIIQKKTAPKKALQTLLFW